MEKHWVCPLNQILITLFVRFDQNCGSVESTKNKSNLRSAKRKSKIAISIHIVKNDWIFIVLKILFFTSN